MLSIRRLQVMVFTVLAVLLTCTVGTYADDRFNTRDGRWMNKKVFWKISTGHHSWNSYNTHSWHRVFVRNDSTIYNLTVEFWWEHKVVYVDTENDPEPEPETDASSGSFSVSAKTGVNPESGSREGWLGPDVSLGEGMYQLISKTKVKITNDREPHPQTMPTKTVTKETDFMMP